MVVIDALEKIYEEEVIKINNLYVGKVKNCPLEYLHYEVSCLAVSIDANNGNPIIYIGVK